MNGVRSVRRSSWASRRDTTDQPNRRKSSDDQPNLATTMELHRQPWEEDGGDDIHIAGERFNRTWSVRSLRQGYASRSAKSETQMKVPGDQEQHPEYSTVVEDIDIDFEQNPSLLLPRIVPNEGETPLPVTLNVPDSPGGGTATSSLGGSVVEGRRESRRLRQQAISPTIPTSVESRPRGNTPNSLNLPAWSPAETDRTDDQSLGGSIHTYTGSLVLCPDGTTKKKSKMQKIRELLRENKELQSIVHQMQQDLIEKDERLREIDNGQRLSGEGTKEHCDKEEKRMEALLSLTALTKRQQECITGHHIRYRQLKDEFDRNQVDIKILKSELSRKKKEVTNLDKEIDANLLEISSLRKELSDALEDVESLEEEHEVDRNKLLYFARELALTKAGQRGASDDIVAIAEQVERYDEQVRRREQEIEAQRIEMTKQAEQIGQLQLALEQTQMQVEKYERKRDDTVSDMETYYQALKHELEEKNRLLAAVEQEKQEILTESTETTRALEEKCEQLSAELIEAQQSAEEAAKARDTAQNELKEEQDQKSVNAKSTELDELRKRYDELEHEQTDSYRELEEEVGTLRLELTEFKAALREATVRNRTLNENNHMLKAENASLLEISQDLKHKLKEEQSNSAASAAAAAAAEAAAAAAVASAAAAEQALSAEKAKSPDEAKTEEPVEETKKMPAEEMTPDEEVRSVVSLDQDELEELRELRLENESLRYEIARMRESQEEYETGTYSPQGARSVSSSVGDSSRSVLSDDVSYYSESHGSLSQDSLGHDHKRDERNSLRDDVVADNRSIDESTTGGSYFSDEAVADDPVTPGAPGESTTEAKPEPEADQEKQQSQIVEAAAKRNSLKGGGWRAKLFKSVSPLPSSSSQGAFQLPAADNSNIASTDLEDLSKEQLVEKLEKANKENQELKSELICVNAAMRDDAYIAKKRIQTLTAENDAYEVKVAMLEKMLEKTGGTVETHSSDGEGGNEEANITGTGGVSSPAATDSGEQDGPHRDWSAPPKFHDRIKQLEEQVASLEEEKRKAEERMHAVENDLESFQRTTQRSSLASSREIQRLQEENAEYERKLAVLVKAGLEVAGGND